MAQTRSDSTADGDEKKPPGFGGTIFLQQAAHVAVLDGRGRIITVNDAWDRFGRENGLDPAYRFVGVSYAEVCQRAVESNDRSEGARQACDGIGRVLATHEERFSLIYPCHAPDKQRWFLMYARPIGEKLDGAVVSHIDVTSLHLAGLVPDETAATSSPPRSPDAPSSTRAADALTRLLFSGPAAPSLASIAACLR